MKNRRYRRFEESFKLQLLQEYYSSGCSLWSIARKYDIRPSVIAKWEERYPVDTQMLSLSPEIKCNHMKKKQTQSQPQSKEEALERRVQELEKALEYSDLRARAYSIMIDIAEKTQGIEIRKKYGANQ